MTVEELLIGLVLGYQFAELKREQDRNVLLLQHSLKIAHSDALTGLANCYALYIALAELLQNGTLTFIDIDNLKLYNDYFGHRKGDELLQTFGNVLLSELHGVGVLHRIGGDEFAIKSHHFAANKVVEYIENAVEILRQKDFVSAGASYGMVISGDAETIDELKEIADTCIY